jgi:hypothetical protein
VRAVTRPLTRTVVLLAVAASLLGLLAGPVGAQAAEDFVADLRGTDVSFEEGAASEDELQEIADVAADLSVPGAYYKVVLLVEPVESADSEREFADQILDGLGGSGRVQVNAPGRVGIASNVDPSSEVAAAEVAALEGLERFDNVSSVLAAADVLGLPDTTAGAGGGGGGGESSDGAGSSWLVVVLVVLAVIAAIVGFLWWVSRSKGQRGTDVPASTVDLAAQKVRAEVDRAANLIIELSDAQSLPGFTDEARSWFRDGATQFAELQDDLEEADTRAELEAVWPLLRRCTWKLGGAKELAAGRPAPAEPAPEPLIPQTTVFGTPPTLGGPVPGTPLPPPSLPPPPPPGAGYQSQPNSPWLTQTAVVAMSVLAAQGIGGGNRTRSGRDRRPPSDDGWFGDIFGGGGGGGRSGGWSGGSRSSRSPGRARSSGGSRSRSSGGGRSGRVGRGVGRRR